MPVDIDTTEAPALLRITFTGALPTPEEQQAMRERLIADGLLTADSACLIDVRAAEVPDAITIGKSIAAAVRAGIPRRRACVINPGKHLAVVQYFQKAIPWMTTAAFINEAEALEWLLNPEGAARFRR